MKSLAILAVLLIVPCISAAQVSAEPLVAMGLISGKSQCVKRFQHMRAELDLAFEAFIRKNSKFFDAETWRKFDSTSFPFAQEPSEKDCKAYLNELPSLDADRIIERARKESECIREADAIYDRLGAERPQVGIELSQDSTSTVVWVVHPGSPAFHSGLRPNDVVRSVGENLVETQCDLALAIMKLVPGKVAELTVVRGASTLKLEIRPIQGSSPTVQPH